MDESLRKEFNWLFSEEGGQLVSKVESDFRNRVNALTVNKSLRKQDDAGSRGDRYRAGSIEDARG